MDKVEPNSQRLAEMEWLDLRALTRYAAVSERTIREWIHRAKNPLPAVQVGKKILVRRSLFDHWLQEHVLQPAESINIDGIANQVLSELEEVR
jgi:excisionase family DNA binding protein